MRIPAELLSSVAKLAPGIGVQLGSVVGAQGWFQGTVLVFCEVFICGGHGSSHVILVCARRL